MLRPDPLLKQSRLYRSRERGNATVLFTGVFLTGLMASVMAIDLPAYYVAQNQLQTSVNAAAIAGAYKLPVSQDAAETAAVDVGAQDLVAGQTLTADNFDFAYESGETMTMTVNGHTTVPTLVGKMICSMSGQQGQYQGGQNQTGASGGSSGSSGSGCDSMTVYAQAKAVPAARDTVLVVDTSSSMSTANRIGQTKTAAATFVDDVSALTDENGSVDRIGLVHFDRNSSLMIGLTAKTDYSNTGFTKVKSQISALKLYSGSGWNTNFYQGLKTALDELEAHGRKNAKQSIIFLTDGYPNMPAPSSYSSYNSTDPYTKCSDLVNNSTPVKNLCYYTGSGRNRTQHCYYMPDSHIQDWMIQQSGGLSCGQQYVDYMDGLVSGQIARAKADGVTINTIQITDSSMADSSQQMLARLTGHPITFTYTYELDNMAIATSGQEFSDTNAQLAQLNDIYNKIAQDVKVKLSN